MYFPPQDRAGVWAPPVSMQRLVVFFSLLPVTNSVPLHGPALVWTRPKQVFFPCVQFRPLLRQQAGASQRHRTANSIPDQGSGQKPISGFTVRNIQQSEA